MLLIAICVHLNGGKKLLQVNPNVHVVMADTGVSKAL